MLEVVGLGCSCCDGGTVVGVVVVVVIVVVVVTHTFRSNPNWILFVPCKQKIYIYLFIQLVVKVCQKLVSVQLQLSDKKCFVKLQ